MVYILDVSPLKWDRIPDSLGNLHMKLVQGIPLQQSDIPVAPQLRARFKVPDIALPTQYFLFVSDRGRAVLEELAPYSIAYFPLDIRVPARMEPAKNYWLIEVTSRAQFIDWDRSPTVPRVVPAPDGGESRTLAGRGIRDKATKFKPITFDLPPFWREADAPRRKIHVFASKWPIFMRDQFWEALSSRLPGQLGAERIAES